MTKKRKYLWFSLACALVCLGPPNLLAAEEAKPKQKEPEAPLEIDMTDEELAIAIKKYVEANCFAVHEPTVMKLENGTLAYSRITCDRYGESSSE